MHSTRINKYENSWYLSEVDSEFHGPSLVLLHNILHTRYIYLMGPDALRIIKQSPPHFTTSIANFYITVEYTHTVISEFLVSFQTG